MRPCYFLQLTMQITKRWDFHHTSVVICLKEAIVSLLSDPANLVF